MVYRIIQVVCVVGWLISSVFLVRTGMFIIVSKDGYWHAFGMDARTSFWVLSLEMLLPSIVGVFLFAFGFLWATRSTKRTPAI